MVKIAIIEAEDQLKSIRMEKMLLVHRDNIKSGKAVAITEEGKAKSSIGTFILTKTDLQKKVFGLGYPALPVMTVEEMYQQRIKDGTWSKPHSSDAAPTHTEEDEAEAKEALQDKDDEETLERQRRMDEFKDDHRRGWGNRANRS